MDSKRFEVLYKQGSAFGVYVRILRDKETGVQYLLAGEGYSVALTPLLDQSGKPAVSSERDGK